MREKAKDDAYREVMREKLRKERAERQGKEYKKKPKNPKIPKTVKREESIDDINAQLQAMEKQSLFGKKTPVKGSKGTKGKKAVRKRRKERARRGKAKAKDDLMMGQYRGIFITG